MKKKEVIKQVDECISSIFTKEDVKKLIEKIDGSNESDESDGSPFSELHREPLWDAIEENIDCYKCEIEVTLESGDIRFNLDGDADGVNISNVEADVDEDNIDVTTFVEKVLADVNTSLEDLDELT